MTLDLYWLLVMANILANTLGCAVALMPLYIRITSVNVERVSKANLLMCLIPALLIMFRDKIRHADFTLKGIFLVLISHLIIFQFEPASFVGVYQAIAISLGLLFIIKYNESYREKDSEIILNWLCIGGLIQAVIGIVQYLGIDLYREVIFWLYKDVSEHGAYVDGHKAVYGSLQNPNLLGAYLALCIPAFFRTKLLWIASIPLLISLCLAGSLIPIAAAMVSIAYYFTPHFKLKNFLVFIMAPIAFYAFCFLFPHLTSDRAEIWINYLSKVNVMHFLIGKSSSWLPMNIMNLRAGIVDNVHNEYLTAFNIFGIGAIVAIIYLLRLIVKNQAKEKVFFSVLLSGFFLSLGSFPMHIAPLALIIMISIAHTLKGNYVINLDR
jgi:hypothetical protein